ncbi:hypothetical protein SAMN04489729_6328 [Amycolatopsis lurida]|uniref:Lipoprotein n=1 Tax=Amycolatopsis lurida NRRL 2430 TaxID=1460371 RepID=A0A2P2G0Q9_AMYLU|nr:hypothetical protein [Amycolatopsis lurida]KFU82564.1 hypothetical protein BB31_02410 [Amycolatopsis lurida NRRL 2430]SEE09927.1 hypothetical protein SAMN04489729_6328 [Amycolatopsis lurida]
MKRVTTLAAITTAAVLALSACGGEKQPGAAAPAPAPTEQKSLLSAPLGDPIQLATLTRESTKKAKSFKMTLETVAGTEKEKVVGQGVYDGDNPRFSMTLDDVSQKAEVLWVDNAFFFKLDADDKAELKTDKAYVKLSADGQDPISQVLGKMMSKAIKESDPSRTLEQVSKAGKITKSDQVELNGELTNHYVIEIEVEKVIALIVGEVGIPFPADVQQKLDAKLKGKNVTIPTELWLNADQLPLQVVSDQTAFMKAMGVPGDGVAKSTVKYTDWGSPVNITAPPADQVGDLTEIMKKAGR